MNKLTTRFYWLILLCPIILSAPAHATVDTSAIEKSVALPQPFITDMNIMLKNEMESFYIYTAMELYFENQGLTGMASWSHKQASEELEHFQRHVRYVKLRNIPVELNAISSVSTTSFKSPLDAFEQALAQEAKLGQYFIQEFKKAKTSNEASLEEHLNWFIKEQDEEVDMVSTIIDRLKIAGDGAGTILIDKELGKRK